jgi:SAM-dependent methyltransferase
MKGYGDFNDRQRNPVRMNIPVSLREAILDKLVCPACTAGGLSCTVSAQEPSLNEGASLLLSCPNCRAVSPPHEGILDLAGMPPRPKALSVQWIMELKPLVRLYEKYWRPLVTIGFSNLSWEMETSVKLLDLSPGLDVLDLACGPGNFTRLFSPAVSPGSVVGADLSLPMLRRGLDVLDKVESPGIVLMRADVTNWPFNREAFHRIHCAGALHLFPDLLKVFRSIYRSLKPGGLFVGATYCRGGGLIKTFIEERVVSPRGFHWFVPEELQGLSAASGFTGWEHHRNKQGIVFRVKKKD